MQDRIKSFNKSLVDSYNDRYNIIDYIRKINDMYTKPISGIFIDKLIEYIDRDECCIPYTLLGYNNGFEILSDVNLFQRTEKLIKKLELIEGEEYLIRELPDQIQLGTKHSKAEYYFHPYAFKIILIKSINAKLYINYYLLLDRSIKFYSDYQIMYEQMLLSKIHQLERKIASHCEHNEDINNSVIETETIKNSKSVFKITQRKQYKPKIINGCVLLQCRDNTSKYYFARGSHIYIDKVIKKLAKDIAYEEDGIIKYIVSEYVMVHRFNDIDISLDVLRVFKEEHGNDIKIRHPPNVFHIKNETTSSSDIVNTIQEIINRSIVDIE